MIGALGRHRAGALGDCFQPVDGERQPAGRGLGGCGRNIDRCRGATVRGVVKRGRNNDHNNNNNNSQQQQFFRRWPGWEGGSGSAVYAGRRVNYAVSVNGKNMWKKKHKNTRKFEETRGQQSLPVPQKHKSVFLANLVKNSGENCARKNADRMIPLFVISPAQERRRFAGRGGGR